MSCTGLYADVRFINDNLTIAQSNVRRLTDMYNNYKNKIAVNLQFSPDDGNPNQCEFSFSKPEISFFSALTKETELEFFEIHFDTSTYDKVERDIKVTLKMSSLSFGTIVSYSSMGILA